MLREAHAAAELEQQLRDMTSAQQLQQVQQEELQRDVDCYRLLSRKLQAEVALLARRTAATDWLEQQQRLQRSRQEREEKEEVVGESLAGRGKGKATPKIDAVLRAIGDVGGSPPPCALFCSRAGGCARAGESLLDSSVARQLPVK